MFYEYAIDPAALSSWERVRYFLDALGPWKGRFLARYPRRWQKMVYSAIDCPDVEKSRVEERLRRIDERVFSTRAGSPYDPQMTWLSNALAEHARVPFRAIVADAEQSGVVLDAGRVDEQSDLWRVENGCLTPRNPAAFVALLGLLLRISRKVVLIDPYFRADQDHKTQMLVALAKAVEMSTTRLEVHFFDQHFGYDTCIHHAERRLPRLLPEGASLTLRCWKERAGGRRLHNRYILTEVGGVKFGDGIETGEPGHEDHLSILDEPSRAELWNQYTGNPSAFDQVGELRVFEGRAKR